MAPDNKGCRRPRKQVSITLLQAKTKELVLQGPPTHLLKLTHLNAAEMSFDTYYEVPATYSSIVRTQYSGNKGAKEKRVRKHPKIR